MTSSTSPKRFALLVGVDFYQSNGARRGKDGEISLRQLGGCVNDTQAVEQVVRERFGIDCPRVLTATAAPNKMVPTELAHSLPTFKNIKQQFDDVYHEARRGDLFFFYFSGHGARLPIVKRSPKDGRTTDPSLMTVDYCCGKPAVRGWQLNSWLKKLHKNKVQVIVILDSCYSGGAWRDDISIRSPENWEPPPNLPADEEAAEAIEEEANRDSRPEPIWGIDPEGFTLMTACRIDEVAAERIVAQSVNREIRGVFTFELLQHLDQTWPRVPTYRNLRDKLDAMMERQTPKVYGRERLIFFGNKEPFSAVSIPVQVKNDHVIVPLGELHGIQPGTEFTSCVAAQPFTIQVDWVDTVNSGQQVSPDMARYFKRNMEVFLSRPSVGKNSFTIHLEPKLWKPLQPLLATQIAFRLSGPIELVQSKTVTSAGTTTPSTTEQLTRELKLCKSGRDGVDIFGPKDLIGYDGAVRGLNLQQGSMKKNSKLIAISLAHLFRFGQILNLRHQASRKSPDFKVSVEAQKNHPTSNLPQYTWNGESHRERQSLRYSFVNDSTNNLYVTVLILSPGFHVRQLWPTNDDALKSKAGDTNSFKFYVEIPERLKQDSSATQSLLHRDIIRTFVSTHGGISLKGLEMPDIWDAVLCEAGSSGFRDGKMATVDDDDVTWWIKDEVIMTRLT